MAADGEPRVVYIEREQPLRKFYGDGGSYLAEDFKADMERLWERYSNAQRLTLLHQSIGSAVAGELRLYPKETREILKQCLDKIVEVFGEQRSTAVLLSNLLRLEQHPGEPVREYSVRVAEAGKRLTDRQATLKEAETAPKVIRDHFVDGLHDVVLRRFLRNQIKEKPAVTLLDLRATAITWSQDKPAETAPTPAVTAVTAVTAKPDLVE